jgi:sulfide:quinone oxidoreductase
MAVGDSQGDRFEVVIAGGGQAGLEAMLALAAIAGDQVHITLVEPRDEFRYRPMAVREPFAPYPLVSYPMAEIVRHAGGELVADRFKWLEPSEQLVHTDDGAHIHYDALLLALGARSHPRFPNALTLDASRLAEQLSAMVASLEADELRSVAYVVPSLPIWSLPAYELALMTKTRAAELGHSVEVYLVTPEDAPLAALGLSDGAQVGSLLTETGVNVITSANCQIREPHTIEIYPLRRSLGFDQVIALPELYAPATPGVPTSAERGFITVDQYGAARGLRNVYAAGDVTDMPVKHGGLAAEQAAVAAEAIAALSGVDIEPRPLHPVLNVMLNGAAKPLMIRAQALDLRGIEVEVTDEAMWSAVGMLHSEFLGPCLAAIDAAGAI